MGKALIIGSGSVNHGLDSLLRKAGFHTSCIRLNQLNSAAFKTLRSQGYDLLLIEEETASRNFEQLPALRRLNPVPIVVMGKGKEQNVVDALIQGADAYLSYSASDEMMLAQVNALMRRHPQPSTTR